MFPSIPVAPRLPDHRAASAFTLRLMAASLLCAALGFGVPARAADVTLNDLRYDLGIVTVQLPRIEVRGTALSESELRALLDPSRPGDAVERLARLEATSVRIPEFVVTQTVEGTAQVSRYRDVTLEDIRAGVIGRLRIASVAGDMRDGAKTAIRFSVGETMADAVDLPLGARVLTGSVPDPSKVALAPLYRSVSYRNYVVEMPGDGGRFTIDRVTGREAKARPGKEPLLASVRAITEMAEKQKGDGASKGDPTSGDLAAVGRMLGFMENFEYGVMDAEGIRGTFKGEKEQGTVEIAAIRFSDQAQSPGFAMSGIRFAAGPARFALDEFEMRDFSFREQVRAAVELLERGDVSALATEYSRLIPKLGSIRLKGMAIEAPDTTGPRNRQAPPALFRATLRSMEISVPEQVGGIPTALRFSAEELAAPLPTTSREQGVKDLLAMGYKDISLSWLADIAWQQASEKLDIKALNLSGKDMLTAKFSGQLSNVGKDAFSTDAALAQVAWLSAAAQALTVTVQNHGFFEKVMAREAAKANKQPDALRREWGMLAAVGLPAILGDSAGAKALTGAISRFVAKPGTLEIDLRARSASGIGVADAVAVMGAPQAIFDKIEVKARAE